MFSLADKINGSFFNNLEENTRVEDIDYMIPWFSKTKSWPSPLNRDYTKA